MTTTQYKSISALNFEISGIFNNSESIYNNSVMMSIDNAQYLLDMQDNVTEIAIYLHNIEDLDSVYLKINDVVSDKVEKWNDIGVNKAMIAQFKISGNIFMIIFGGLASIGILNTMMMIVLERKREIGIMEANGLSKKEVFQLLFLEGIFMGACGTISGIILGSAITWYFSQYGLNFGESVKDIMSSYNMSYIIYPQVLAGNIFDSAIIGLLFTSFGTIIPVLPQIKKKPSELIRE
jgi:putative ABC transport system permease protein